MSSKEGGIMQLISTEGPLEFCTDRKPETAVDKIGNAGLAILNFIVFRVLTHT